MANGVAITAGSGTTIATDQLADNSHVQLIKLLQGPEDDATRISQTDPLPVVEKCTGAFTYGALTVGTTAVRIKGGASELTKRRRIVIQNLGSDDIFLAFDNSVTVDNGLKLAAGETWGENIGPDIQVHAISPSAGQDVRYQELA